MTATALKVSDTLVTRAMNASGMRDREKVVAKALKVFINISPPANPAYPLDDGPLTDAEIAVIRKLHPQALSKKAKHLF